MLCADGQAAVSYTHLHFQTAKAASKRYTPHFKRNGTLIIRRKRQPQVFSGYMALSIN